MIRFLPLLCLAGCQVVFKLEDRDGGPAAQTIEFVQSRSVAKNAVDTLQITLAKPVEEGDLIIVVIGTFENDLMTLTDSANNQYTEPITPNQTEAQSILHLRFTRSIAADPFTVTATTTPRGMQQITMAVHAYRGGSPDELFDQQSAAVGNSATATSGPVTTAVDGELYFAAMTHDNTVRSSAAGGFLKRELPTDNATDNVPMITADLVGAPAGTVEAMFEMTDATQNDPQPASWACQLLTFE